MDLGHPDVVFPLIISVRDVGVGHERQGLGFEVDEPIEQNAGLAAFESSFLVCWLDGLWAFRW